MSFSEAANRGITGHGANSSELVANQRRMGAHTGGRGRGFAAGMAAANHNDVESVRHQSLKGRLVAKAWGGVKDTDFLIQMFHVKHFGRRGGCLFPDTEVPENHVEDILNIDSARQAPKRTSRDMQLLGE